MIATTDELKMQIKALAMVGYSMMMGLLFFTGVSYIMIGEIDKAIEDVDTANTIAVCSMLSASVAVMLANGFLKRKHKNINDSVYTQPERVKAYRTAYVIYLAAVEAIGIIGIICFLLTGKPIALIAPLMSIVQMFLHRPTVKKLLGGTDHSI